MQTSNSLAVYAYSFKSHEVEMLVFRVISVARSSYTYTLNLFKASINIYAAQWCQYGKKKYGSCYFFSSYVGNINSYSRSIFNLTRGQCLTLMLQTNNWKFVVQNLSGGIFLVIWQNKCSPIVFLEQWIKFTCFCSICWN